MRIVGSDRGLKEVQVNEGAVIPRQKDGTFHVDQSTAKALVKSGDFAVAGTNFRNANGYVCNACGFNSLYRDKCGKCGSTELTPEA
jgi:ribosomal protein L40E